MEDPQRLPVLVRLLLVWIAGSMLVAFSLSALAGVLFAGGAAVPLLIAAPIGAVVVFRLVDGSPEPWPRAVGVFLGGTVLLAAGWAVVAEIARPDPALLVLAGLPYAVVAALLAPGRLPGMIAGGALLATFVAGSVALRFTGPDEAALRLAAAGEERGSLYVVEVPGYLPSGDGYGRRLGSRAFMLEDHAKIPPYLTANVAAFDRPLCSDSLTGSRLDFQPCETEPGGLVYRHGADSHGYEVRRHGRTVIVSGSIGVDRAVLREGARTVRPAGAKDLEAMRRTGEKGLFVADLPGFRVDPVLADGVAFAPLGGRGGPEAVSIMLSTGAGRAEFCARMRCETEPGGLLYRHGTGSGAVEEQSGYLLARADTTVQVTGGAAVDRAVLRTAVLAARHPTGREIVRALPPPGDQGPVGRWRGFLKEHF
ncbi:hypothetical protein AB0F72_32330 [Actinoplanes sp. NPDC023936]|uniref:hypothetical protein n=1 Tax=Actinoplanes sp. NPDC023936 TaxID=3154910 RepID=UPI0033C783B4